MLLLTTAAAFVFGALIGSFLNVVIYRLPEGISVVTPPSRCPSCGTRIRWYDNVPILSWLALGGRCRGCDAPIKARYAVVEATCGVFAALIWGRLAAGAEALDPHWWMSAPELVLLPFALYFAFVSLCICIAMIDLDHTIIPHALSLPGIALGVATPWLLGLVFAPERVLQLWPPITPEASWIGAIAGALIVLTIFVVYLILRGVAGMGGGDVTLMAMMGAWLGWPALTFIFMAASVQALLGVVIARALGWDFERDAREIFEQDRRAAEAAGAISERDASIEPSEEMDVESEAPLPAVPFGPFIVLAGLEYYFLGPYLPEALTMAQFYLP